MTSETHHHPDTPATALPTTRAHCVRCGVAVDEGWDFCGGCGVPLPAQLPAIAQEGSATVLTDPIPIFAGSSQTAHDASDPSPGDASRVAAGAAQPGPPRGANNLGPTRRRTRRQVASVILTVLVLVALAGGAGYWQQHMGDRLQASRQNLARTSAALSQARATLAETNNRLSNAQMELNAKSSQLTDTQERLRNTQDRLREAQRKLSGLQGSLSDAQDRLDLQANQIETLKSCLNGVTNSLTYAARGDYNGAVAALDAVQVSCQRAQEML